MQQLRGFFGSLLWISLISPISGFASDGVIEINQAIAMVGGVNGDLAADAPGFPVEITQPGSYRLTSDLNTAASDAIVSLASAVTIDLGGFSVIGPGVNSPGPVAISIQNGQIDNRVINGTLRDFGNTGFACGTNSGCIVEDVVIRSIGLTGFASFGASELRRVTFQNTGARVIGSGGAVNAPGPSVGMTDCRVIDTTASAFGNPTVVLGDGAYVARTTISGTVQGGGLRTGAESLIEAVVVRGNAGNGIEVGPRSQISTAVVAANTGHGIRAGSGSNLVDVTVRASGKSGVVIGDDSRMEGALIRKSEEFGIKALGTGIVDLHLLNSTIEGSTLEGLGHGDTLQFLVYMGLSRIRNGTNLSTGTAAVPIACNRIGSATVCP